MAALFILSIMDANAVTRNITAQWQYPATDGIAGFRLYQEGTLVCTTNDPAATSLNCTIDTPDGESWFTMTAFFDGEIESIHSQPFTYIFSSGLKAAITADVTEGESPLPISFNGAGSTGSIVSYEWMFGDGDSGTGNYTQHTYAAAGNYTVSLKVTDDTGAYDYESLQIIVSEPATPNNPPTAVLSSSTGLGQAPLVVQFDGNGSSDSDGTIVSFSWTLGDGNAAIGQQISYTYVNAGTYYPSLTVTDNGGMSDTVSTPILVQPAENGNIAPTAVIHASAASGKIPLRVNFHGNASADPDGKITSYSWSFGDGSSASGSVVKHIYNTVGTYKATLHVTDDKGAVSQPAVYYIRAGDSLDKEPDSSATQVIINFLLLESNQ